MQIAIEEIKEKLKSIDWNIDIDHLKDDMPLFEQGLDSLDMLDLLLCLEQGYCVKIPDNDVPQLRTLADFSLYLTKKVQ